MEREASRPLPPLSLSSPKSFTEIEADAVSIVSSLESLPPPPEPFPLDELLRHQQSAAAADASASASAPADEDACSDTATVHYDYDDMTDVDVVGIQRACADVLTALLPKDHAPIAPDDQHLTVAVSDLLEATYELETFHPSCSISSPHTPPEDAGPASPFHSLLRVLVQVQAAASKRLPNPLVLPDTPSTSCDMHPAVSAVREELAWARVESLSQAVSQLVRERDQPTSSLAAQALPPKYRRSERNSSEGSDSLKSLPPYNAHQNDSQLVDSSPSQTMVEKPITGAGDLKARMEEEAALEEAQRRAAARQPLALNKMGTILNDLDTVTHAIERLQSFSQMQDQRVELRPSSSKRFSSVSSNLPSFAAPVAPERPQGGDRLTDLDSILEKIERTDSRTDRMADQRIDFSHRRASRRQKLLVNTLEDTARTLEEHHALNAEGNLARARDLRERAKFLNGLYEDATSATGESGVSDHESELNSPSRLVSTGVASRDASFQPAIAPHPTLTKCQQKTTSHQENKVSHNSVVVQQQDNSLAGPSSTGQVLYEKKKSNRRMFLYDDGPLTPQSHPISPRRSGAEFEQQDTGFKSRSLSPVSLEFMFKELPMPPDHEPRSRKTSRDTMGAPRRSLSPATSDFDHDATVRPRRARSPPRAIPISSRSSSLARMPLREGETFSIHSGGTPMSPTFSDISNTSSRVSVARGTPIRSAFDDHYLNRLSTESKVSTWSKASSTGSRLSKGSSKPPSIKTKGSKPPSLKSASKPPSIFSGARSPSSRSLGTPNVDRQEDLFDLLSFAASSGRMSNQEVELPRVQRRYDLTPKADWGGLNNKSEQTPPVTPRIVESVADGEWVIRLQDQENGGGTPRTPYSALTTGSSLGFPEVPRSARRNSFSSIMSVGTNKGGNNAPVPPSPTVSSSGGGLKKFAASFKSNTINRKAKHKPPPLRTSGVLDGSAVTSVTEYQENIRSIQVLISGVDTTFLNTADLQLEVTTPNDALLTSKSDPTLRLAIALPSPAQMGQTVHLQPIDDYLEAKLSAVPTATQATGPLLHTTIAHALSAPNLRSLAPRSLCCTSCDRVVAHLPLDVEFKDLPSEYWAEMIEVWMCHADPSFTSQLAKHTSDGFWPSPDTVLVGGSYLLVSGSHICDSHLILEKSNEPDQWRIITCPCGEVLGKLRPEDGRPGAGTVRFSKWAIALLRGKGAGEISPVRFPVSTFVVSDMLELSQAHASHRFIICDERTGDRRLAIWVFNPSIRVAYRRSNDGSMTTAPLSPLKGTFARHLHAYGGNHGRHPNAADVLPISRTLRAAKIMFKVLDPNGSPTEYENLPGFGPRGQVEHLRYSRDVCVTLIETLRATAALYPASRRNMGSFEVGFLERI